MVPTLRKELVEFVMSSDDLLASIANIELSPAETAIVAFYMKEIAVKMAKGPAICRPHDLPTQDRASDSRMEQPLLWLLERSTQGSSI
jgi:hypothetical protein